MFSHVSLQARSPLALVSLCRLATPCLALTCDELGPLLFNFHFLDFSHKCSFSADLSQKHTILQFCIFVTHSVLFIFSPSTARATHSAEFPQEGV